MERPSIFVIDDEANIRATIKAALESEGFGVTCFENPLQAIEAVKNQMPALVVTDLVMPQLGGLELIRKVKAISPEINVLMVTAYATLESAIGAIRAGASDYLVKPFKIDDLTAAVKKSLSQKRFLSEASSSTQALQARYGLNNLIGSSSEIKEVRRLIEKVAGTDTTVLIVGESGTGKEVAARAIHYHSKRRNGPFVSINCAALPETLLESELFGYEKGAFTGAVASKAGLFELAENGTFLLDEVGEMPVSLQVKLFRVLQERTCKHLGGVRDIHVNFRLIAATSKNLHEEMKAKRFREELFYRLNVIPIFLPPLRDRKEDIPLFVSHFLDYYSKRHGIGKKFNLTQEALDTFSKHPWPGNVRELENVIERLITLAETETVGAEEVGAAISKGSFSPGTSQPISNQNDLRLATESYERELIEKALEETSGNKNKAAKKLQLTRQALHYKLKKYNLV